MRLALGEKNTTSADKKPAAPGGRSVAKRQYLLSEFGDWDSDELSLLQAGLLYPVDPYYGEAFHIAEQLLQQGLLLENHKSIVHQPQEIATSPPRNPTKPIYHYTPLPQGTFPAPRPEEMEMARAEAPYMYGNHNGPNALHAPIHYIPHYAGLAYMPMPAVQYLYYR